MRAPAAARALGGTTLVTSRPVLARVSPGVWGSWTVSLVSAGVFWLLSALALLSSLPASMSAWVRVWLAVQTSCWPGASVPGEPGVGAWQLSVPRVGSVIATPVRVVLPVLVAVR